MLPDDRPYISPEDPEAWEFTRKNPPTFLDRFSSGVVRDQIRRVPERFSYLFDQRKGLRKWLGIAGDAATNG